MGLGPLFLRDPLCWVLVCTWLQAWAAHLLSPGLTCSSFHGDIKLLWRTAVRMVTIGKCLLDQHWKSDCQVSEPNSTQTFSQPYSTPCRGRVGNNYTWVLNSFANDP
jgi:hypothetical protein